MHGCMGAVNKGARSLNGEILGVIHEKWCVDGEEDPMIPDMIVVGEPIRWTNCQSCCCLPHDNQCCLSKLSSYYVIPLP
jgi:hypothetical protein